MFSTPLRNAAGSLVLFLACSSTPAFGQEAHPPTYLLSGQPAGNTAGQGVDSTKPGDALVVGSRVIRTTSVTTPTATWYPAPASAAKSATLVVLPGGGYHVLAEDLEGTEICTWLNSLGISALLLRYRVPTDEPHAEPLADAQAALSLLASHASAWNLDMTRIGVIGFSAGAHLAARLASAPPTVPLKAMMLIYPAYLQNPHKTIAEVSTVPVTASTPPSFLVQAQDDPVGIGNALTEYAALTAAHIPAEVHLYAKGGHGYGMRPTPLPITHWNQPAAQWLRDNGFARATTSH